MAKKNRNIIFDSEFDYNETREMLIEDYKEEMGITDEKDMDLSDNHIADYHYEMTELWLQDEKENLNIEVEGQLIAIAELNLWNGKKIGYKLIGGNNVKNIFTIANGYDNGTFYCDRYNVCADLKHHDGTNYVTFREIKSELSDMQVDNFLEKIYVGNVTSKDISRYTKSLRTEVADVYGW